MTMLLDPFVRRCAVAIYVTLALGGASGASAQVVRGRVIDSILSVPLSGVTVELMSPQRVVGRMLTDDSGHFAITLPSTDTYRFRAQRVGYRNMTSIPLPIDAGSDATITLRLVSLPVALESLVISASSQIYLQNAGFYERRRSDPGIFLLPDAVVAAATKATQTADVLAGIPGMTMLSGGGSRGIRIPQFTGRSGIGCDNGPRIYLDSHVMNPGSDAFDVNSVAAADLLAIEIYRHGAEVPLKFGGTDASCGVLVLWTKH